MLKDKSVPQKASDPCSSRLLALRPSKRTREGHRLDRREAWKPHPHEDYFDNGLQRDMIDVLNILKELMCGRQEVALPWAKGRNKGR